MRKLDLGQSWPTISVFDSVGSYHCYIRLHDAYRTNIQMQCSDHVTPWHSFVFDDRIEPGRAEIRDAADGSLCAIIENMAVPIGITRLEEVNA